MAVSAAAAVNHASFADSQFDPKIHRLSHVVFNYVHDYLYVTATVFCFMEQV